MRPSRAALVPLVAGVAWLAFKAEYLRLDAPSTLKALIVSPGFALLVASAFVAFPDARRRLGGSLVAFGLVAALWVVMASQSQSGWTFYTPYASMYAAGVSPATSPPSLVALTLLIPVGIALFLRRSLPGALLIGAAFWMSIGFPSELDGVFRDEGMPRRYRYYYRADEPSKVALRQKGVAAVFLIGGVAMLALRSKPRTDA